MFGGTAEDYLAIHDWFDESKAHLPDLRHRALRHHSEGIFLCERLFGPTVTNEYRRGRIPAHYRPRPGDATADLSQVRHMTLREATMLQTFPEGWSWLPGVVLLSDAWQMVANAVPPKLAEHLGRALLEAWEGRP